MTVAFMAVAFGGLSVTASASVVNDIPQAVNEALFDGANLFAARTLLATAIMASALLAMAVAKVNMLGMGVMTMLLIGALVAIGWLDYWILAFCAIIMAVLFGTKVATWLNPDAGGKG